MTQRMLIAQTAVRSTVTAHVPAECTRMRRADLEPDADTASMLVWPGATTSDSRGTRMWDEWPRRSFLELGALSSAVPCARLHARQLLWEWKQPELIEPADLLVSELVTNAIKAARALGDPLPVKFWLLSDDVHVVVVVWDANPQPPMRVDLNEEAEGGRGLLLVEALSKQWDWYATPDLGGKVVWALVGI